MEDNNFTVIGNEWENEIIRETIVEMGDEDLLRLFDEEQKEMKKRAEEEIEKQIESGEIIPE